MIKSRLTTVDNPYDPFDEFREWYKYDEMMGHHTTSYLARIVKSSNELSESDQEFAITSAIDSIVEENITGLYRKIERDSPEIRTFEDD